MCKGTVAFAVNYEGKVSMSEDLVIRHCSPTLAGIKTGNLFSCDCPCRKELTKALSGLNRKLVPRGIRILPLRVCGGRALIYVYRPHALESDLADQRVRELLLQYGYTPENLNACVLHLIYRLRTAKEFPHEIGIFLGYPLEDVDGFITHQGENCKLCGCWKVYGNVEQARRTFASYEKCRVFLCAKLSKGCNILQALKIS